MLSQSSKHKCDNQRERTSSSRCRSENKKSKAFRQKRNMSLVSQIAIGSVWHYCCLQNVRKECGEKTIVHERSQQRSPQRHRMCSAWPKQSLVTFSCQVQAASSNVTTSKDEQRVTDADQEKDNARHVGNRSFQFGRPSNHWQCLAILLPSGCRKRRTMRRTLCRKQANRDFHRGTECALPEPKQWLITAALVKSK